MLSGAGAPRLTLEHAYLGEDEGRAAASDAAVG